MTGSGKSGGTSVADLRAQMRTASAKSAATAPPPPPKKKARQEPVDPRDERAERAERLAMAQHQTSLLSKAPRNDRTKPVEKKKGLPLLMQLLLVVLIAGGVALALDPALMAQAKAFAEPHIFTLREMLNV